MPIGRDTQGSGACETSGVPVELQGWKGGLWVV